MKEVFAQSFLFCFLMGGLHSLTAEQLPPGALVYRNPDGTHLGLPWEIQEHGPQNFQIELQQGILMELILESQLENGEWLREAIPFSQEQGVIRFFLEPPAESLQIHLFPLPAPGTLLQGRLVTAPPEKTENGSRDQEWTEPLRPRGQNPVVLGHLNTPVQEIIIPEELVLKGGDIHFNTQNGGFEVQLLWQSQALPVPIVLYTGPPRDLPVYTEGGRGEKLILRLLKGPLQEGDNPAKTLVVEFRP
jgi:hypothetical protein